MIQRTVFILDDSVVLQPVSPYSQYIGASTVPSRFIPINDNVCGSNKTTAVIAKELLDNGMS